MSERSTEEERDQRRVNVSLSLRPDTLEELDKQSEGLDRSRSWIADMSIRRDLGLLPTTKVGDKK